MASTDLASRSFLAIDALQRAGSAAELDQALGEAFADLGITYYGVARFFAADRTPCVAMLTGRYQTAWADRYTARGYAAASQMTRAMLTRRKPYSWSDVLDSRPVSRVQARIVAEAREHGLRDGLYCPGRWPDGSYAAVILSGAQPQLHDPLGRSIAEVLGAFYFMELKRLLRGNGSRCGLSPRQRDCLLWVREGKSSQAISGILGISVHTVDEHVREACRRLGVRTRVQAAVEAFANGLLDTG